MLGQRPLHALPSVRGAFTSLVTPLSAARLPQQHPWEARPRRNACRERRDERCGYMARRGHAEMCWCCAPLGQLAELLRQAHHFRRGCKHSPWFLEGAARAQVPFLSTVASAGASLKAEGAEHQGHLCSSPLPPAAENSMSRAMSRVLLLIKHSLLALITHQGFRSARPAGWFGFAQRCPAVRLFLPAS